MATINYQYPVTGAAPSTNAVKTVNQVTAQVVMGDTDLLATITHNFVSSVVPPNGNGQSDLANLWPEVAYYPTAVGGTLTIANPVTVAELGTLRVVLAKAAQTGSAITLNVLIKRPNSLVR